ncbi:hypothetical protein TNCV_2459931 [Trichonephila clavipes]|nr:hypothetical protein TNCV_2459931 [Trichonephila clavipes]
MMEPELSARRVARQLCRSDYVLRRCWDQRIQEMSFTRRSQAQDTLERPVVQKTTLSITAPITCAALDAHSSTPPFGVIPLTRKLDSNGMEPGRL